MAWSAGKRRNKYGYLAALLIILSIAGWMSPAAMAQQATAAINGTVKDQSGAAIPNARKSSNLISAANASGFIQATKPSASSSAVR